MKDLFFDDEHDLFRSGLRDFLKSEVAPHVDKWEATGTIDRDIWKKMGEMGYFSMVYPEQYGGLGLDHMYTVILCEELQRVHSGGFAAAIWAHVYLAMTHLNSEGSEEIKEKYLTASIEGDKVGCLCITEPYGGSDVASMRTTAVLDGDSYVLNGSKTFITNGVYSDYLIVVAKTDMANSKRAMGIFLVDRDTPGVSATKLDKLGWRASDTGEIAFDNVRIPASHLMGDNENGFYYVMQHFSLERLIMGVNAHARAEYALEYTLGYMSEREAFGKKINEFQALRHRIADMVTEVEIVKTFNYHTAYRMTQGEYVVKEATMSKLQSTTVADKVLYECIQMLGGYGFMEEFPLARMWRDSRLGPIGGGTSEILREIIAKIVIDNKSYKAKL